MEQFIVKKHNKKYWSIYNVVENGYLMVGGYTILFSNEKEAQTICKQLNNIGLTM